MMLGQGFVTLFPVDVERRGEETAKEAERSFSTHLLCPTLLNRLHRLTHFSHSLVPLTNPPSLFLLSFCFSVPPPPLRLFSSLLFSLFFFRNPSPLLLPYTSPCLSLSPPLSFPLHVLIPFSFLNLFSFRKLTHSPPPQQKTFYSSTRLYPHLLFGLENEHPHPHVKPYTNQHLCSCFSCRYLPFYTSTCLPKKKSSTPSPRDFSIPPNALSPMSSPWSNTRRCIARVSRTLTSSLARYILMIMQSVVLTPLQE